jgi:hypothetical protein
MQALQKQLKQGKRVFVLVGEAGSGKSEIAVNWALRLAAKGEKVRFIDMDQTKPLFRSREACKLLKDNGVLIDESWQCLDSPTIPAAVFDRINDPDRITILDVGGSAAGARTLGQLADAWGTRAAAYLVVNGYRPFSGDHCNLPEMLEGIVAAARVETVEVISNPNFGEETTLADVVNGYKEIEKLLAGARFHSGLLAVPRKFVEDAQTIFPQTEVFGITRYIKAPWEIKGEVQEEDRHGKN